jgi:hypothetical protein
MSEGPTPYSIGGLIEGRPLDRRSASLETTPRPAYHKEGQRRLWRSEGARAHQRAGACPMWALALALRLPRRVVNPIRKAGDAQHSLLLIERESSDVGLAPRI